MPSATPRARVWRISIPSQKFSFRKREGYGRHGVPWKQRFLLELRHLTVADAYAATTPFDLPKQCLGDLSIRILYSTIPSRSGCIWPTF